MTVLIRVQNPLMRQKVGDAFGTKNRRRKSAPENGVDLWRRFLERVSWVLHAVGTWNLEVTFNHGCMES